MPTPRPQQTALSPALRGVGGAQEPPSLCLMKAWDFLTSSLSPFPSRYPLWTWEAWSTPHPTRGEGATVALGVTPLDGCLENTAWLGELQEVDGGRRSWRMKGWELQNPGTAQGLRPKSCTDPWINSCPPPRPLQPPLQSLTTPPVSLEPSQKCHPSIHSLNK